MTDINQILLEVYPKIRMLVGRWTKDTALIEDLVQDVAVKCLENEAKVVKRYQDGNINGWLNLVVRNRFLDEMRKRSKLLTVSIDKLGELESTESDTHYLPNLTTKGIDDIVNKLESLDRIYIETWIECGFNTSKACRESGISREKFKNERVRILALCRELNIF